MCRKVFFLIFPVLLLGLVGGTAQAGIGTIPTDWSIIAQYHFDEGSGQDVNDASGNRWHGYRGNSSGADPCDPNWTADAGGYSGLAGDYALDFAPLNGVTIPLHNGTHPGSVAAGLMVDVYIHAGGMDGNTPNAYYTVLRAPVSDNNSTDQYNLFLRGDGRVRFAAGGSPLETDVNAVTTTGWYRITAVYDDLNNYSEIFVDGVSKATNSSNTASMRGISGVANEELTIGMYGEPSPSLYGFDGLIDEVTISSAWRVVAQWHFDDGSGDTMTDVSGNGWDGFLGSTTGIDTDDPDWTASGGGYSGLPGDYALDFERTTSDRAEVPLQGMHHPAGRSNTLRVDAYIKLESIPGSSEYYGILDAGDANPPTGQDRYLLFTSGTTIFKSRFACASVPLNDTTALSTGSWYLFTGVFYDYIVAGQTNNKGISEFYINGERVASWDTHEGTMTNVQGNTPLNFSDTYGGVGGYPFDGLIDEVTISIAGPEPDYGKSWSPTPAHNSTIYRADRASTILSWKSGDYKADANGHNLYFSTDWDDVNDANNSWPVATGPNDPNVYKGAPTDPDYALGTLDYSETYYWRVDEVNGPNVWKGDVWKFKVPSYFVVDDMESYDTTTNLIYRNTAGGAGMWLHGAGTSLSGSKLDLETSTSLIRSIGSQSMKYEYDNDGMIPGGPPSWIPCYSEIETSTAKLGIDSDWTREGVEALDVWFYGDNTNVTTDTEQLYVAIADTNSPDPNVGMVIYDGDMNNLRAEVWKVWHIDLDDFNDVDLADVDVIYIGFGVRGANDPCNGGVPGGAGTVYFDDIRLYEPRCVWNRRHPDSDLKSLRPGGNWQGNCIVNFYDLDQLLGDWLVEDYNVTPTAPNDAAPGLQAWYKFDGDALDYSGYGRDADVNGDASYVDGSVGPNSILLDGNFDYVTCGTFNPLGDANAFTVAMWTYWNGRVYRTNKALNKQGLISKRDAWSESGMIWQLYMPEDGGNFPSDDSGMVKTFAIASSAGGANWFGSDRMLPEGEWAHVAVTYDGTEATVYVNGLNPTLAARPFEIASGTDATVVIGNVVPTGYDSEQTFNGKIDEVRIYNYVLSQAEVLYLAKKGDTSEVYQPVISRLNLYDGEAQGDRVINFRDFAVMAADRWLEDKLLWP